MAHLYKYCWIVLFKLDQWSNNLIFYPFLLLLNKLFKRYTYEDAKKHYNNTFVEFPGGMIDWAAYGAVFGITIIPIIILTIKFDIDIYTEQFKAWLIFGAVAAIIYYYIYIAKIKWLTTEINDYKDKISAESTTPYNNV